MSKEREFLKKLRYASLLENDLRKELEELLAQPEQEQELVGVVRIIGGYPDNSERVVDWVRPYKYLKDGDKLYLAPKREPLSDEEIVKLWANKSPANEFECVRLVEKAHGIGGEI